jgi:hypothetical protein
MDILLRLDSYRLDRHHLVVSKKSKLRESHAARMDPNQLCLVSDQAGIRLLDAETKFTAP